jgi:hypothetical protein
MMTESEGGQLQKEHKLKGLPKSFTTLLEASCRILLVTPPFHRVPRRVMIRSEYLEVREIYVAIIADLKITSREFLGQEI